MEYRYRTLHKQPPTLCSGVARGILTVPNEELVSLVYVRFFDTFYSVDSLMYIMIWLEFISRFTAFLFYYYSLLLLLHNWSGPGWFYLIWIQGNLPYKRHLLVHVPIMSDMHSKFTEAHCDPLLFDKGIYKIHRRSTF
jgi:hypothetical protein